MANAWEQQPGEPTIWFRRFTEFYLAGGEDRSIDGAYRTFRARQQTGVETAAGIGRRRASGDWFKQSAKWSWHSRANAYDAHQVVLFQREHAAAIRKANEKHLVTIQNHFNKLIRQTQAVDYSDVTDPLVLLKAAKELILLERLLLGMPLTIDEARSAPVDPAAAQAIRESAASAATPEMMAEVFKILDAQGAFDDDECRPDASGRPA